MRGQHYAPAVLYPGKEPVPIVQEAGWAPGPVWTGAENLAPTGIRSPDRPTLSQSLYRLSYPANIVSYILLYIQPEYDFGEPKHYTVNYLKMIVYERCVCLFLA